MLGRQASTRVLMTARRARTKGTTTEEGAFSKELKHVGERLDQMDERDRATSARLDQMDERDRARDVRLEEMDQRNRGMMVLLEHMDERSRATIDAVFSVRDQLNRRIDDLRTELTARIDVLEIAVRDLSAQVKKNSEDIQKNTVAIGALEEQVKEIRALLERKADQASMLALEKRVSVLEEKLGVKASN